MGKVRGAARRSKVHTCTSWYAYAAMFGSSNQQCVTNSCPIFLAWP